MTFFQNDQGVPGVLIEKLDVETQCLKKDGKYNHFHRDRRYAKIFKKINTTGPIDQDGNPIDPGPTSHDDFLDVLDNLEKSIQSAGTKCIEQTSVAGPSKISKKRKLDRNLDSKTSGAGRTTISKRRNPGRNIDSKIPAKRRNNLWFPNDSQ